MVELKRKMEMEAKHGSLLDSYRSSSSSSSASTSSPCSKIPSGSFLYMHKPTSLRQPISYEDSPEWEDAAEIDPQEVEETTVDVVGAGSSLFRVSSGVRDAFVGSPPLVEARRKINRGATVVWKELAITIKGKRKYSDRVVKSSTGFALPGTLTVIMGPAKSGKSTLLRAIAGRLPNASMVYGEMFVNGVKAHLHYGTYGYVQRDDVLIGSLTVREMLYYASRLQLPCSFTQRKSLVEDAILAMSLGEYADRFIGHHCTKKGLDSGEKRRVSIARELVTKPHILFIDEPIYQLDSVSALLMMVTLKKLTSTGCTIIFTMYQSSTEVFGLFDRICLLSNGNTLFFGGTLACLQHFSNAGFPCPIMQSPSDHFLRAINTDFDRIIAMCKNWQDDNGEFSSVNMDTAVAICTLENTYNTSGDAAAVEAMVLQLIEQEGPTLKSKGRASCASRVAVLTWRSFLLMSRDWKYFWLRLALSMGLMLCIGTVFFNAGHSLSSVTVRVSALFSFVSFSTLVSVAGVPTLIREIQVFENEESSKHSSPLVFLLANILSSIPFLFVISVSSSLVFYFLVGMRNEFNIFMYFILNFFTCLTVNEGLLMVITCLWMEQLKAVLTMLSAQIVMMLVAGYFRRRSELPVPVWKYPLSLIAFHTYSLQGLLENEYGGTSFAVGQVRSISGMQALQGSYDVWYSRNSKWKNLLVLVLMAVAYRIVLFILLYFRVSKRTSCIP